MTLVDRSAPILTAMLDAPTPVFMLWAVSMACTIPLAFKVRTKPSPLPILALVSLILIAACALLAPLSGPIMSADLLATARRWMLIAGLGGTLVFTAIGVVIQVAGTAALGVIGISAALTAVVARVRHTLASLRVEFNEAREEGRRKREKGW